ncbi:MAG: phosphate signaling complex protein PhoU [Bacillaceae bacterium]
MTARPKFEGKLAELHVKLVELGDFTVMALEKSMKALKEGNAELALQILEDDKEANYLEEKINVIAIRLITREQPVAIDLRKIITAIKISGDLERMADYAVNIAKSSIRIGKPIQHDVLPKMEKMFGIMIEMVKMSVEAFHEENLEMAKQVCDKDDDVDDYYGIIVKEIMAKVPQNQEEVQLMTQLAFLIRYIERVADHATNIAENVFYLVKGTHYVLNK